MSRLQYTELEEMIRDLQSRVEKGIKVEQDLINTKNELDAELNRFRLMQRYSSDALKTGDLNAFCELTVEYFVEIFNLPRILFVECGENEKPLLLAQFGFPQDKEINLDCIKPELMRPTKSSILHQGDKGFENLEEFGWVEAILCPICDQNEKMTGAILAGIEASEQVFYGKIENKIADSFALMTQKAGDHLQILQVNNRLKKGIADATSELETQAEELKRSNRDLEQFAYVTSHDLKAPLRNIASFVQLLNRKYHDQFDEEGREFMHFILGGVRRLDNLIKDLLQYSRVNRVNAVVEHIDLHDVFNVVQHNLSEQITKQQAKIEVQELPILRGNYSQMVQLVQNILSNAVKFSKKGVAPEILVKTYESPRHIGFAISDNGIGIDPKDEAKVFSIFQRLHSPDEYEGTGIGLSICKRIVERHHGKIWYESEPKKGATFIVQIPRNLKKI